MNISPHQLVTSLIALLVSIATVFLFTQNALQLGNEPLVFRALVLSIAILAALIAVYPFYPVFSGRPITYGVFICLPALLPGFLYFLYLLPQQAGIGLSAEQLSNQLITDSSSNGIIEVGFSYPIFTPTIKVTNQELFTRHVNIFLRITDSNNEVALFRAVRSRIPSTGLSVEATVQGMLSENEEFLFLPLKLPPVASVSGKVVFVISNLDDGATFTEALGRASQAQFELREPETGVLIMEFPLNRL
ncbi:MAG: hypothetical protein OSB72_06300 [Gammaproteobacteria bacterium]|jgi:hypothetical protein|nr:hypothetical protein [Gammaproteobacteria bacterium]